MEWAIRVAGNGIARVAPVLIALDPSAIEPNVIEPNE